MSPTGIGQAEFDDGFDNQAECEPRDLGAEESPEMRQMSQRNHRSEQDSMNGGKTRCINHKMLGFL